MKRFLAMLVLALLLFAAAAAEAPTYSGFAADDLGEPEFFIDLGSQTVVYLPLDSAGRVHGVSALLTATADDRRTVMTDIKPAGWQQASYPFISGLNLYNRCHLLAHQLGGAESPENLFTGTQYINHTAMVPIEDAVAAYIRRTGNAVRYEVLPYYSDEADLLCAGVTIAAQSVGDSELCLYVFCHNVQPGIVIDYSTGFSALADTAAEITERAVPEATDSAPQPVTYVLNVSRRRFHLPSCPSVEEIKDKNRRDFTGTREELLEQGYKPCGRCNP